MSARHSPARHRTRRRRALALPEFRIDFAFYAFLVLCALTGGASRVDSFAQIVVQFVAIAMVAVSIVKFDAEIARSNKGVLLFAALCALLVIAQCIPLPFSLWAGMPGHSFYAGGVAMAGVEEMARPWSMSPDLTLATLVGLLPPLAALLAMLQRDHKSDRVILTILVAIALFSAALGLAQLSGGEASPLRFYAVTNVDSPVGVFANRNHQAILMVIAIAMAGAWAALAPRAIGGLQTRWIAAALMVFFVPVILLNGSRNGMLLAPLALIAGSLFLLRSRSGKAIRWKAITVVIGGAILAAGVSIYLSRALALERLMSSDLSSEGRVRVLRPGLQMVHDFFPFGTGIGTFDTMYRRYEQFAGLSTRYMNEAHNDLLQLAIEAGLFGLALLATYLVWWGSGVIRLWRTRGDDTSHKQIRWLGAFVTAILLLASLTEYPLRTPFFEVLFVVASCWMLREKPNGRGALEAPIGGVPTREPDPS
jgi:O-antigen ligase